MKIRIFLLWIALVLLVMVPVTGASASEPVVYGVFFYTPTCPYCHEVMDNHWPGIQQTFGEQLMVLFVDVSIPGGAQIMHDTRAALNIESNGVPMLVIGETVLVGSIDIPARTPGLVQRGLAAGGIDVPSIPRLQTVFQSVLADYAAENGTDTTQTAINTTLPNEATLLDRFNNDPIANGAAVLVLLALLASFGTVLFMKPQPGKLARNMLLLAGIAGLVFGVLLLAGSSDNLAVLALAGAVTLVFAFLLWHIGREQRPAWLLPLTALAGLGVAAYLSYIELTLSDAVCGAVGDCNAVQQSAYAQIFGIPIGVIGIAGYAAILLTWGYGYRTHDPRASQLVFALALVGSAFSAYLTFLEPFFIGATCLWCLTSAVVMLLILWLAAPLSPTKAARRPAHA